MEDADCEVKGKARKSYFQKSYRLEPITKGRERRSDVALSRITILEGSTALHSNFNLKIKALVAEFLQEKSIRSTSKFSYEISIAVRSQSITCQAF